jgi:hypothetical protein
MGIAGNKAFVAAARLFGLRFGVKLSDSGGAQINFHRGGAGTPGSGDTVPAVGFTRRLLGEVLTVEDPKDGFRADSLLPRIWAVLDGEDVIKISKKGITVTGTTQSPLEIDNYDDEDVQGASTALNLINYHTTPNNSMSFKTSRGSNVTPSILSAGDSIGVTKWYGYKAAAYEIAAQVEVLADTGYGTYADGTMLVKLRDHAGSLNTILEMNGDGITSIGTINGAVTLRHTFTQIGGIHYKTEYAAVPSFYLRRANGTEASPSNLADADQVGDIIHSGRIGGSFIDLAHIRCKVIESDTGESRLQLRVCDSGGSVSDSVEVCPEGASVASTLAYHVGSPTVNDSWRIRIESNDLVFERRESAAWVEKSRIET